MVRTVTCLAAVLQTLFTVKADELARRTKLVKRERELSGSGWVQTLALGWGQDPQATLDDLTDVAAELGVTISPQGLDAWFCEEGVECLQQLVQSAVGTLVQTEPAALPLLQQFHGVYVEDCTNCSLPPSLAERYSGCGGNDPEKRDQAALKTYVRLELQQGNVSELSLLPGRQPDVRAGQQAVRLPAGALRLKDLGFFDTQVMAQDTQHGVHWISRLPSGVFVQQGTADSQEIAEWLKRQKDDSVDCEVAVGKQLPLRCRLLAVRCPDDVRQRRLRKLTQKARKDGRRPVSERQRVMCGWLVLVTDLPAERLTINDAWVLYRTRWQIELLFKLWKSHGRLDKSRGERPARVLCEMLAKLLGLLVQHWMILVAGPWLDGKTPLKKARRVRRRLGELASVLAECGAVAQVLAKARDQLDRLRPRAQRHKQPLTIDLLKEPWRAGLTLS